MNQVRHVRINADALRRGGASDVLAVEPSVIGGLVKLRAEEPPSWEPLRAAATNDKGKATAAPGVVVGLVRIEGPLAQKAISDMCGYVDGYDAIASRFELTIENEEASAVLMVIDSPGGDVAGLEAGVARMQKAKKKHGKKVVAYLDELAASAAYWIAACVADEIVLPVAGRAGSIGCIGAFVDLTAAAEQYGEKWHVVREPAGKADMFPLAPVTDLALERLKTSVEAVGKRFYKAIADARGLKTDAVKGMNGCVFEGKDAVTAKLADSVGTLESALSRTQKPTERASIEKEKRMNLTSKIAIALGLASEASETDAIEAFGAFESKMLSATKASTLREAAPAVEKLVEKVDGLVAQVSELEPKAAESKALKEAAAKDARTAAVDKIIVKGSDDRKITPAKRAALREKGITNGPEWLQSVVDELPVLAGGDHPPVVPNTGASDELSAEDKAFAKAEGLTEDEFREIASRVDSRHKKGGQ